MPFESGYHLTGFLIDGLNKILTHSLYIFMRVISLILGNYNLTLILAIHCLPEHLPIQFPSSTGENGVASAWGMKGQKSETVHTSRTTYLSL